MILEQYESHADNTKCSFLITEDDIIFREMLQYSWWWLKKGTTV